MTILIVLTRFTTQSMIELIRTKPAYLIFIIISFGIIVYGGDSTLFLLPIFALVVYGGKNLIYPFAALLLLLPLADSTFAFAQDAYNTRPVLLILLGILILTNNSIKSKIDWSLSAFIPYFVIVAYYAFELSSINEILKPISYFLVIAITPVVVKSILQYDKESFLRTVILLYTLVFIFSFLNIEENQTLQNYGRFSGIFNTPNALGIFSFLFFMLSTIVFKFHPALFTKAERYFVTGIIVAGVIYSRSRSGMFAILIFWLSLIIYERHNIRGLIIFAVIAFTVSYTISFENIIRSIGLADFFRLESLETGSGRKLAFAHAWLKIKEQPLSGYGIGFTEKYFIESQELLAKKGHVGSVHNSFLWVWLDLGLFGLLTFIYGWYRWFKNTFSYTKIILPVSLAVLFSVNVESWLMGSLNHVTIQLIIILSLLSSPEFFESEDRKEVDVIE